MGIGADHSRMPQALLVLQRVADRWAKAAAAASFRAWWMRLLTLRRLGFRFIALADDNFYPVTFTDLRLAREQNNTAKLEELTAIRNERLQLMEELAKLPKDMVFFTQMTMEAGEDGELSGCDAAGQHQGRAGGRGGGNAGGTEGGIQRLELLRRGAGQAVADIQDSMACTCLGSFIFGLPTDRPATFDATVEMAMKAGVTFAQFVMMTPFPGTVDFGRWEKEQSVNPDHGGRRADHALLDDSH